MSNDKIRYSGFIQVSNIEVFKMQLHFDPAYLDTSNSKSRCNLTDEVSVMCSN